MKYNVLEIISLKTSKGEIELHPGQVVALNDDIAIKLLNQVKIALLGKASYRIYSKILDDYLWVVATEKALQELLYESIKDVVYTQEEVSQMIDEGVTKEELKSIHKVKSAFPVSSIEGISKKS